MPEQQAGPEGGDIGSGRMEGHGFYTEHSQAQEAYGELGFEWLEQAAAEIDPPAPSTSPCSRRVSSLSAGPRSPSTG
ncbi:MAG TPA: hypothetical protein VFJ57_15580 [Solirubrobacterales bacterium]|nr:hypothetical protein [Solirubrobacterales bacterium]